MPISTYDLWPKNLIKGPGSIKNLGAEIKRLGGTRVIIFSGPHISLSPTVQEPIKALKAEGLEVELFNKMSSNPTDEMVLDAVEVMKEFKPDIIVAIGGGSPIDCAKAANVYYTHGGTLEEYDVGNLGFLKIKPILLPMIAIPTTSGSGSEATAVGVITDTKRHIKYGIHSAFNIPTTAILDAELTVGLGKGTTAFTGMDAMTHLIEAYVSLEGFPLCDGICLKGIEMIHEALPIACSDPSNIEARDKMIMAAYMGGVAINLNHLGLCHQMSHQQKIAHGLANAIILPRVMKFNMPAQTKKFADIAKALGVNTAGMTDEEAANKGIEVIEQMNAELGIPKYLDEAGVDKALVPEMAENALKDGVGMANPRKTTLEECIEVFNQCFSK